MRVSLFIIIIVASCLSHAQVPKFRVDDFDLDGPVKCMRLEIFEMDSLQSVWEYHFKINGTVDSILHLSTNGRIIRRQVFVYAGDSCPKQIIVLNDMNDTLDIDQFTFDSGLLLEKHLVKQGGKPTCKSVHFAYDQDGRILSMKDYLCKDSLLFNTNYSYDGNTRSSVVFFNGSDNPVDTSHVTFDSLSRETRRLWMEAEENGTD